MTTDLSPGVYSFEVEPELRQIQGVATSTIGMVGITERGEVGVAKSFTGWSAWVKECGSYISTSDAPQSVFASFLNGAREIIFTRTMHYSDITNGTSQTGVAATGNLNNAGAGSGAATLYGSAIAPFELANAQTLIVKRDGVAQPTLTIAATRAVNTSVNGENQVMSGGKTLTLQIDGGNVQTITFVDGDFVAHAAATAEEVAAVINAQLVGGFAEDVAGDVVISSDTLGTGSIVAVTGGTAQALWDWVASVTGTGNVINVAAVTIAELKALVEALVTGITVQDDDLSRLQILHDTAASTSTLQIDAASTADTPLGLDNNMHAGLDSAGTNGSKTSTNTENFILATGDVLNITTDLGGPTASTFTGAKALGESTNSEPQVMSGGKAMTVKIDGGSVQTISFVDGDFAVHGAATAEEIVEAANKQLIGGSFYLSSAKAKVTFQSDTGGTDSRIEVTGGTAQALWLFPTLAIGSGNVASIAAVTIAEAKLIIEAAVPGVRVTTSSSQMVLTRSDAGTGKTIDTPSGTALTKFGYTAGAVSGTTGSPAATSVVSGKTEGTYGNDLVIRIAAATSAVVSEFDLFVLRGSVVQEFFTNLTMGTYDGITLPTDARYAPTIINAEAGGADFISITDSLIVASATARRPANADYTMSGGDDGLVGLVDVDFIGDAAGENGLRSFDIINTLGIIAVPGRATSAVHNGMLTYCETTRKGTIFAVLDPPAAQTADQMILYTVTTASLKNASEYGAIYWPEVKVSNPSATIFGNSPTITIPPSGPCTGAYARTDSSIVGGVYLQPAGVEEGRLLGVIGLASDTSKDEAVRDKLYPQNINPIWMGTGIPAHADGSANLKRDFNFPSIGERRGVIFIKRSLEEGLLSQKHKNNTADRRRIVENTIRSFLLKQMDRDAFATKNPDEAFYVDMGSAVNPPSEQAANRMNARIGLATAKPGEFINLFISQDTRALQEQLATS